MSDQCTHKTLQLECSAFAEVAGFERPDARARLAATSSTRLPPKSDNESIDEDAKKLASSFPGPLVLPWDDLNHDPKCPPQSFSKWLNMETRNKPTEVRKTLYVAAAPEIADKVAFMGEWIDPVPRRRDEPVAKRVKVGGGGGVAAAAMDDLVPPDVENVVEYLTAFYHGMSVKEFSPPLRFVQWKEKRAAKSGRLHKFIGLSCGRQVTRIRVRGSSDGIFAAQLNLNDLLDAATVMLPEDAYSIVLLVDHDMYEDEDDDFCCGRAYGGSRVAVVQTARYNPSLDVRDKIDFAHSWPLSHCADYVDELCALEGVKRKERKKDDEEDEASCMRAAITAASRISKPSTTTELQVLWFSRIARTVAHELGHCMGIAHCVYYACSLQGTAGTAEDGRQPPYLCPVCLSKISYAVAVELRGGGEQERRDYVRERYEQLGEVCRKWEGTILFEGFRAWIGKRVESLES